MAIVGRARGYARHRVAMVDVAEVPIAQSMLEVIREAGVAAARLALALRTAGSDAIPDLGSWSVWMEDPNRPIATGPTV